MPPTRVKRFTRQLNVDITEEMYDLLGAVSFRDECSMSTIVRLAVNRYLREQAQC